MSNRDLGYIQILLEQYNQDRTRLMDRLWDTQHQQGYISEQAIELLANGLSAMKTWAVK